MPMENLLRMEEHLVIRNMKRVKETIDAMDKAVVDDEGVVVSMPDILKGQEGTIRILQALAIVIDMMDQRNLEEKKRLTIFSDAIRDAVKSLTEQRQEMYNEHRKSTA